MSYPRFEKPTHEHPYDCATLRMQLEPNTEQDRFILKHAGVIKRSAGRISELIEDLLSLAKDRVRSLDAG
jgi:hypothetical protein